MQTRFAGCVFDSDTREVVRGGRVLPLSPRAYQLLDILIRERPKAISKEKLHQELWPATFVSDANLANLVADLRAALGDDARPPQIIRTLPRFGYAFRADTETAAAEPVIEKSIFRLLWRDREIALREGENVLGRDEASVAWIDVSSVSRHHARIVVSRDRATVEDLGSKNGTYLKGRRVEDPAALADGDELRIGTVSLIVRRFRTGVSTRTARSQ
jgi:DNA-binding winged helix-turn-helix (wHTH) protein